MADILSLAPKFYGHAVHNGSNYLNGQLIALFSHIQDGKVLYLSVSVRYQLWDKEKSKLALNAELAAQAMKIIVSRRQVILLCDSWYTKAEVAAPVETFENLKMDCNARVNTVLYGLSPARSGKKGHQLSGPWRNTGSAIKKESSS